MLFPPPPPAQYTEEWNIVNLPTVGTDGVVRDTSRGAVGAMTQRLVNGRTLDLSLRAGPMHAFQCPGEDDGRETCALTCASEHLSRLRAFTVTGEKCVHSPSRTPPLECADDTVCCRLTAVSTRRPRQSCRRIRHQRRHRRSWPPSATASIPAKTRARIWTRRSSFAATAGPAASHRRSAATEPRVRSAAPVPRSDRQPRSSKATTPVSTPTTGSVSVLPLNSLTINRAHATTIAACPVLAGQDGRTSTDAVYSSFVVVSEGVWAHLCGFLTDKSDCGPGVVPTVNSESFLIAPTPPRPRPPPPDPSPPPPPREVDSCRTGADACLFANYCSDGGLNSLASGNDPETGAATFYCSLGSQCGDALCAPRTDEETLCVDSCRSNSFSGRVKWTGASRNGVCEDGGAYTDVRSDQLPAWSEIVHDNVSFYAYPLGPGGRLSLDSYGYTEYEFRTFEQCAEICASVGGGSLCKYFVHFSGSLGQCTSPTDGNFPYCDSNCFYINNGPMRSRCMYYGYYTGHAVESETLMDNFNCNYNTIRHGFVTSMAHGALPLIPSNYLELEGSNTVSYGSAATLLRKDGLHGILSSATNSQKTTFQQCAETCMTLPNKECRYFILLTPSDGASAHCGNTDTSRSEANGPCLLYGGDGSPSGQTVTQTITESLNALAYFWDNVNNVVCNPGQYRHVKMNVNSYGTYPVGSNGLSYAAVAGCGFGALSEIDLCTPPSPVDRTLHAPSRWQAPIAPTAAHASWARTRYKSTIRSHRLFQARHHYLHRHRRRFHRHRCHRRRCHHRRCHRRRCHRRRRHHRRRHHRRRHHLRCLRYSLRFLDAVCSSSTPKSSSFCRVTRRPHRSLRSHRRRTRRRFDPRRLPRHHRFLLPHRKRSATPQTHTWTPISSLISTNVHPSDSPNATMPSRRHAVRMRSAGVSIRKRPSSVVGTAAHSPGIARLALPSDSRAH